MSDHHEPAMLYPQEKDLCTQWTEDWVGPEPVWMQRPEEESLDQPLQDVILITSSLYILKG
jgi:hypothetical protein